MKKLTFVLLISTLIFNNSVFSANDNADNKTNEKNPVTNSVTTNNPTPPPITVSMPSGATLEIPKGLRIQKNDDSRYILKLEESDNLINAFLIETQGSDLEKAMEEAWKNVLPGFHPKIQTTTTEPIPQNFDAFLAQTYASDKGTLTNGIALKKGKTIWILLSTGPTNNINKRSSQFDSLWNSLKIPEILEEDLHKN